MNPMRKASSHQTIQEIDRLAGLDDFQIINGCETDIPACSGAYENLRGGGSMSCCPERAVTLLDGEQVCARCIRKKLDAKGARIAALEAEVENASEAAILWAGLSVVEREQAIQFNMRNAG